MIIKTAPDKERAKSILNIVKQREEYMITANIEKFYSFITTEYYEIMKELMTAISLSDGFKAEGENAHRDLIDYISNYKELTKQEISLIDDLRIKRNKLMYRGIAIELAYLRNNKDKFILIINKLKELAQRKL